MRYLTIEDILIIAVGHVGDYQPSRTGRFLSVDPIRAADANRSFRIGSLPANANQEPDAPVYQQRLTPSGYVYTGQLKPVQPIDNVVVSSPLFHQRLVASTTGLDVSGYVYVGNNPSNHTDPTGEVIKWNPISYSISSGCVLSKCLGSLCVGTTCGGSARVASMCGGSWCTGSVCIGSSCHIASC